MKDGVNSREDGMLMLDSAYNLARFLSRDASAAEHIVHAAFVQAGPFSENGRNGRAELLKNVRRCYRTWLAAHRQSHRGNGKSAPTSLSRGRADPVIHSDDDKDWFAVATDTGRNAARVAIEAMPRRLREILVLKELEKLTYREIAEVTSLQTGQVMSRLACARRMLAGSLVTSMRRRHATGLRTPPQA
jgi:DNA-directed RNA polymerase specialized sigma24 family protein